MQRVGRLKKEMGQLSKEPVAGLSFHFTDEDYSMLTGTILGITITLRIDCTSL